MSDNVCTRYVHVFMLFSLISMNKELNQSRFSKYPKAGLVPESPVAPLPAGIDMRLVLFEVAELCRCRKMFAVQSHERLRREVVEVAVPRTVTPGSRRNSRSHERLRREVDEGVVQRASSRVKTLPKNLIARVPCRTFSEQRFRRHCSR